MNTQKISYTAYPKLFLEAVIFVFYWLLGKRRDYYKADMLPNPEPQIWDLRYLEFQTHYADIEKLKESYEKGKQTTSAFQSVIDFARKFKKPTILEVGFGRAGDLVAIKKELKDVELYGVEPSNASLEIGRKISNLLDCGLNVLEGDAYHLPFHDKFFDIVFASQVFEHLLNPSDALKEQIRVIKMKGT
ncbi:class I SAM-dependent methyltransferase [Chloroflexota bacterium]